MKIKSIFILLFLIFTFCLDAKSPEIFTFNPPGVAAEGYDVTTFFSEDQPRLGNPEYQFEWKGAKWYFSSEYNLSKFQQNPDLYVPQYGGYCVWAIAHGRLTGGYASFRKIIDNKLYLLCSQSALNDWLNDRQNIERRADQNWPDILK